MRERGSSERSRPDRERFAEGGDRKIAVVAGLLIALIGPILEAGVATAQQRTLGAIANVLAVDSSGNAAPGCAGDGNTLTSQLNTVFGTPGFDDESVGVSSRRALFRACDVLTQTGAQGWTGEAPAAPEQIAAQGLALAPEEIFTSMDNARASFDLQTANVARRLSTLRLARRYGRSASEVLAIREGRPSMGPDPSDPDTGASGPVAPGQSDRAQRLLLALQNGINAGDETGSGLGVFLNGRVHVVKGEENESERGSEGNGGGFTLGIDKQIDDTTYAGIAFGYTRIGTDYDGSASEADLDAITVSVYGAWYPNEALFVDGSISTAWLGLDATNDLVVFDGGPPVRDLQGSTDGVNFGFDIGAGYTFQVAEITDLEPLEGLTFEPFARLNVLYTEIDGFLQKGGDDSLNLQIANQEATSVTGSFGFRTDYAWSTRYGVLTPYFRAAYVHEFNQENDDLGVGLAAVPGSAFKLKAQATDSHYGNFGLGVAATLGPGLSQFVDYDVVGGHDNVTIHQVTIGLRLEL